VILERRECEDYCVVVPALIWAILPARAASVTRWSVGVW
jgi:hypothetical protein